MPLADYRIVSQLHAGRNSRVVRALAAEGARPVILKSPQSAYPTPREIDRLRHEHAILQQFASPLVIKAHALEREAGQVTLVLEDIQATSLGALVAQGPVALADGLRLACAAAEALAVVHAARVVHKDVNPSNLIANLATGQLQLIDFGLATLLPREPQQPGAAEAFEGTLTYIAPEQTGRMNRAVDFRTDLYSLGATLYELFTGRPPFQSADALELIHAHIARPPQSPRDLRPDLPPVLAAIILKLLAKNAEDRYQTAAGLHADLDRCREQLQQHGQIADFPLGQQDVSDRFALSEQLYGREGEVAALIGAFERASAGPAELLLVAGYSGVGKSRLVHEVQAPIVERRGHFVAGKFDQLRRNQPFSCLFSAFGDLIRQILAESDEQVQYWRAEVGEAVGRSGQVLIAAIPELELLIGPQPPVDELPPDQARNRFGQLFRRFVQLFCRPAHPLCIFLDDLQWVDSATLQWIEQQLGGERAAHLLLIGAYRDNEVPPAHPLSLALDRLRALGAAITTLSLAPLSQADVGQLIADSLAASPVRCSELAGIVYGKTGGNPFFTNQCLLTLYEEGAIGFDPPSRAWRYDAERARQARISDNVVELIAGRIGALHPAAQHVLKVAACVGNRFDRATLAVVLGIGHDALGAHLEQAVAEGLIVSLPGWSGERAEPFAFLHDRVQQAALSMLAPAEIQQLRLQIGRLLYDRLVEDGGPGTRDQGPGTRGQRPATKDQGPRTNDQGPADSDQRQGGVGPSSFVLGPATDDQRPADSDQRQGGVGPSSFVLGPATDDQRPADSDQRQGGVGPSSFVLGPATDDQRPRTRDQGPATDDARLRQAQPATPWPEPVEGHGRPPTPVEDSDQVFIIADHLNSAAGLISDPQEHARLARLNLAACRRAKQATAFEIARDYSARALEEHQRAGAVAGSAMAILTERAECLHLCGDNPAAERLYDEAVAQPGSPMAKVLVYERKVHFYTNQARFADAYATGRAALQLVGTRLPAGFVPPLFVADVVRVRLMMRKHAIPALVDLPKMTDAQLQVIVRVMAAVAKAAFQIKPQLCIHAAAKIVGLCLEHGNIGESVIGYVAFGAIFQGAIMGDHKAGYAYGRTCLALVERYQNTQHRAEIHFVVGYFATSWLRPVIEAEQLWQKAYEAGLDSGDLFHATCAAVGTLQSHLMRGVPLDTIEQECDQYLDFLNRIDSREGVGVALAVRQAARNLRGATRSRSSFSEEGFDEAAYQTELAGFGSRHFAHFYYINKMQTLYLWQQYREGLAVARQSATFLSDSAGMLHSAEHDLYHALLLAALADEARPGQRRAWLGQIAQAHGRFQKWAKQNPANFRHKERLLAAELARLRGAGAEATEAYTAAAAAAAEQGYLQIQALANELAARHHERAGRPRLAAFHLQEAAYAYGRWGATAYVAFLIERHPQHLSADGQPATGGTIAASTHKRSTSTSGSTGGSLDLATVLKASETIAAAIELPDLLRTLMTIIIENAGAQRGVLILRRDQQLLVQAEGGIGTDDVTARVSATTGAEPQTTDHGPRTTGAAPQTTDDGRRTTGDREPRTENRGPTTNDQRPTPGGESQMTSASDVVPTQSSVAGRRSSESEAVIRPTVSFDAIPLADYPHLPQSLVSYVARVREPLVLGDAAREGSFTGDPYIKAHQPRSVLCQPLVNQGQLAGLLYLENNLASGAFTPARLRLLNLLSSQAAIAIEKAQLYTTLQASERKYRTLFADSRDSIFIASLDDRIIDLNPAGVALLGYSADDGRRTTDSRQLRADDGRRTTDDSSSGATPSSVVGRRSSVVGHRSSVVGHAFISVADLYVRPDDHARFTSAISGSGSVKDFEAQLRTGDGRVRDCLLTATLRYDEDGNCIGYQGIIRDITAQRRAEQERLRLTAIERELSVATELQQSMLPPGTPDWPELPLLCASVPAREVGGDFYGYRRLSAPGEPGRYALAVGDLTGKGIGAALLMATALSQFDASLALNMTPEQRMAHLDGAIMPYTRPRRQNCGLCYLEITRRPDGTSAIAAINAGGIPPYLKRADGRVEFVEIGGFALGQGLGQRLGYQGHTLEGAPGDLIILTSDGVVEANAADDAMFGFDRLAAAIEAGPTGDAAAMLAHLQATLAAFVGATEPHDDMTIVVARL